MAGTQAENTEPDPGQGPEQGLARTGSAQSQVVVITGMSGAGRSTALRALEDLGFFCVDNLPTLLVEQTVASCERGGMRRLALGIDVRVGSFLQGAGHALAQLAASGRTLHVIFLDASDEALLRRYSSTRRPHPLSTVEPAGPAGAVLEAVLLERERLAPLRAMASRVLDTTRLSVHELRRRIIADFGPGAGRGDRMRTRVMSFGFKYGVPVDADLSLDVRFIDNPFFVDDLRPLSGLDSPVAKFVLDRADTQSFLELALALLEFLLPRYEAEGKSYLTMAIGCTGGRHRSVAIAERIAEELRRRLAIQVDVSHRDIGEADREARADASAR
ncbi:MAG TPA: RNase adapter RapZ [Polyangiaceae bacterium]|nr:RNase adapter RapZ [Polyangiaceae bacterium]